MELNNKIILPHLKKALLNLDNLDKIEAASFDYNKDYKIIMINVVIEGELNDDFLEELRVYQTEILSAFPDGEFNIFKLNAYKEDKSSENMLIGDLIYAKEDKEFLYISKSIFEETLKYK